MSHKFIQHVLLFLGGLLGLAIMAPACTLPANEATQIDRSANFTQAAETLDAQLTLAALGAFPTVTPVSTLQGTVIPVLKPGSSDDPNTTSAGSNNTCDKGLFVDDVSVPDGTNFSPGETFVKTWRIENNGTCTWTNEYEVVFDSGDAMNGPASTPLTQFNIPPGEQVEISIEMTAPDVPGNYRGDWLLRNSAGQTFGLGSQGTASFWIIINVGNSTDIQIKFDNIHQCDGLSTAVIQLENDGNSKLDSVEITLTDLENGQVIFGPFSSNGPFMGNSSECPPGGDSLRPDSTGYIGGSLGSNPSSGSTIKATIRVCTQDNLNGSCDTSEVNFNIP